MKEFFTNTSFVIAAHLPTFAVSNLLSHVLSGSTEEYGTNTGASKQGWKASDSFCAQKYPVCGFEPSDGLEEQKARAVSLINTLLGWFLA